MTHLMFALKTCRGFQSTAVDLDIRSRGPELICNLDYKPLAKVLIIKYPGEYVIKSGP